MRERNCKEDIFHLIKEDHKRVREIIDQIQNGEETTQLKKGFKLLRSEVLRHAEVEERVLHPLLKKREETKTAAADFEKDCENIRRSFDELAVVDEKSKEWKGRFESLRRNIEHHALEEEKKGFRLLRMAFDRDELRTMAERFVQSKAGYGYFAIEEPRRASGM